MTQGPQSLAAASICRPDTDQSDRSTLGTSFLALDTGLRFIQEKDIHYRLLSSSIMVCSFLAWALCSWLLSWTRVSILVTKESIKRGYLAGEAAHAGFGFGHF